MDIREWPFDEWSREEWGVRLREIPAPPTRLLSRGTLPPRGHKLLAVVGSRNMTRYGQEACESLIAGLAGYPVSIVSGLALGVDTCAHKAALAAGLHTFAFPGSGLDDAVLYPRSNREFAKELLASGGGMLSEYEPSAPARIHYFPERNRLMVGVADAVLIVEAGAQSGTLITARLAGEYNRDLLAVPHRIGDPHGFGAHLFIRLGAALVAEPAHILEALRLPLREPGLAEARAPQTLEGAERLVWEALAEPRTRDEIVRVLQEDPGEIITALATLELKGFVQESFGSWRRAY